MPLSLHFVAGMARKHRFEFPGAIYHLINRGNYRSWIFKDDGAKGSFERSVLEACSRYGWVLHAYVIMGNHYHLAVETPEGNLVAGMQWLQAGFANRFNRLRKERGHVFQGRYKALLVEPGEALGQLCHYIHLNPVRARIIGVESLGSYRRGSYWFLTRKAQRPPCLRVATALDEAGGLADTPAGHRSYAQYLAWQSEQGPAGKNRTYVSMSRGWALGSGAYKRDLIREHHAASLTRAWDREAARELRNARWQEALAAALAAVPASVRKDRRKSAIWKVAVACHLKGSTDVPNAWLAEQLDMGSGTYVSKHVGLARAAEHPSSPLVAMITAKAKGKT
ncbi:MAG: transposase [Opitutaceae bacterium]